MNVSRPFPAMSSRRVFLVGAAAFVFAPRGLAHGPGHDPATPAPVAASPLRSEMIFARSGWGSQLAFSGAA